MTNSTSNLPDGVESQDPVQDSLNYFLYQVGEGENVSDAFHDAANWFLESLNPNQQDQTDSSSVQSDDPTMA